MSVYYHVTYENRTVGTVQEIEDGLYRQYFCRCQLPKGIYRLWLQQGTRQEKLGVLCPEGDCFVLRRRIPSSRLTKEELYFSLRRPQIFVPIIPGKTFPALQQLPVGRFAIENGQPGILFSENDYSGKSSSSPTGQ